MKVICKPMNSGKTTELIELAQGRYKLIVCCSVKEAHRIFWKARRMDINIAYPITYNQFKRQDYHSLGVTSILVDNVDLFVQSLTPVPIEAITITENDELPDLPEKEDGLVSLTKEEVMNVW